MALRKNESLEDYLECILILGDKKPVVRGVDIAAEMGFKKSSVSVAMKNLREKEYITVSEEGYISLTDSGRFFFIDFLEIITAVEPAASVPSSSTLT